MRLSDADREALFEALARHAAAGRLDVAELERRIEAMTSAETREEAAQVIADLPPLPSAGTGSAASTGGSGTSGSGGRSRWGWRRGHGDADTAAPDWRPTGERFRDPGTQRVMRVWLDSGGGRHYVPDQHGEGAT